MNTTSPSTSIWSWNRVLSTGYSVLHTCSYCVESGNRMKITYLPDGATDAVERVVKPENVATTQNGNTVLYALRKEGTQTVNRCYSLSRILDIVILPDEADM